MRTAPPPVHRGGDGAVLHDREPGRHRDRERPHLRGRAAKAREPAPLLPPRRPRAGPVPVARGRAAPDRHPHPGGDGGGPLRLVLGRRGREIDADRGRRELPPGVAPTRGRAADHRRRPGGLGGAGRVPLAIEDVGDDPRFAGWLSRAVRGRIGSYLGVPLRIGRQVVGVLEVYTRAPALARRRSAAAAHLRLPKRPWRSGTPAWPPRARAARDARMLRRLLAIAAEGSLDARALADTLGEGLGAGVIALQADAEGSWRVRAAHGVSADEPGAFNGAPARGGRRRRNQPDTGPAPRVLPGRPPRGDRRRPRPPFPEAETAALPRVRRQTFGAGTALLKHSVIYMCL